MVLLLAFLVAVILYWWPWPAPGMRILVTYRPPQISEIPASPLATRSYAVAVVRQGTLLFLRDRGRDKPRPLASTTKIMTAYVLLSIPGFMQRTLTITPAQVADMQWGLRNGDQEVPLHVGQHISAGDLFNALLLPSADDAATVLATDAVGSEAHFVRSMNQTASRLGLHHLRYSDVSGVNPLTVGTPHDLVRLTAKALNLPLFRQTVRTKSVRTAAFGVLTNLNQLLFSDPTVTGVKTGWTSQAGYCLVFSANRPVAGKTRSVIGAVLGEPSFAAAFSDAEALLGEASRVRRVALVTRGQVVVRFTEGGQTVLVRAARQATGWVVPTAPIQYAVHWQPVHWPIRAGEQMGTLVVTSGRGLVTRVPLVASAGLRLPWWHGWWLTPLG